MRADAAVLVDTGPLVALFDPSDRDHATCTETLGTLEGRRLVTTLPVLTEATYLLGFAQEAQQGVLEFVAAGAVEIPEFGHAEVARAIALMGRYTDLPMDFADASLVVLAERLQTPWIFTLDRRDFSVIRLGRRAFRMLPD